MSSLKSFDGKPSGMVFGFANFISSIKDEFSSDYIIFALDSKGKSFRSEIDPNYKANRQSPPEALLAQLPVCIDMIEKMGFYSISKEGYEADDIIASVVKKYKNTHKIQVVTHDKDLYQLIDENVKIYSPAKKELYSRDDCKEKYGVYPEQIRDFLAICGDSSDNIPGIKGIGPKGAKNLLDEFGSLDGIFENISKIRNERTKNMLIDGKDSAFLSKKLATLFDEVEIGDISKAIFPNEPLLKVVDILKDYSLNKLLSNLDSEHKKNDLEFSPRLILDDEELLSITNNLTQNLTISFDTETNSLDTKTASMVGFSFCFDEKEAYYVALNHSYLGAPKQVNKEAAKIAIERIFQCFVVGQNLKFDFKVVRNNFGIDCAKNYADTMILAWLNLPGSSVGMDALAKKFYNYDTIKFEDLVKKGEHFGNVDLDQAHKYASEDAWITLKFYHTLKNLLDEDLLNLARNLEFDFIKVLIQMEENGIKIDKNSLQDLIKENSEKLKNLTEEIYSLCGEKFNINSTKQLGEVLFERLKLPYKKKTKTGYSTDESVLLSLLDEHLAIPKILSYRELYKLQSTYCEPILKLANEDKNSRIYSSFLQTGTSTGRLSSKNPNLQNIPARGALAKKIRDCFVAKDGFSLLSLDYSQIELRLLAHFSKDPTLIKAFKNDEDIHASTAISIFKESDKEKRAIAKSINFGLIYGMGATKLADELKIPRKDAKEYIEKYFLAFSTIKDFLQNIKEEAKSKGYSTTLFNRKRFFDFSSASAMQVAMYEREAVNTKFQGSAADIIKKAMVEILPLLDENCSLLLQIHDELIFEIKDEFIDEISKKIQNIMQNVVKLEVPLKTSLSIAKKWGDLK